MALLFTKKNYYLLFPSILTCPRPNPKGQSHSYKPRLLRKCLIQRIAPADYLHVTHCTVALCSLPREPNRDEAESQFLTLIRLALLCNDAYYYLVLDKDRIPFHL